MASRLADLSQASEASQISLPRPSGPRPKTKKAHADLNDPSYDKDVNPISRMVRSFGKRLTTSPTSNCNSW